MFERYTEEARRTLFFSRYEATQRGSTSIEPHHVLIGLIREGRGMVKRILARSGVSLETLRTDIEDAAAFKGKAPTSGEVPFSAETKRLLQNGAEEADRLLHNHIGPEHLLLGIMRDEGCAAASILRDRGVRIEHVREAIVELQSSEATEFEGSPLLRSRPARPERPRLAKPDLPASYDVHISPTTRSPGQGTHGEGAPDCWVKLGFELKGVLSDVFGVAGTRIDLPVELSGDARYDFSLVMPRPEKIELVNRLVQQAIEKHFNVTVRLESRSTDACVLTASGDGGRGLRPLRGSMGGGIMAGFHDIFVDTRIRPLPDVRELLRKGFSGGSFGLHATGSTIADFCSALERNLGRVFVDETGLTEFYEVEVRGYGETFDDVIKTLRDQLGLVATFARREILMLVVRKN